MLLCAALLGASAATTASASSQGDTFDSVASRFPLTRLGSEDGLSHNGVHAVVQDRHGFLWFGTQDGLNRYDGREFVVYRWDPADPTSLASNFVTALLEDTAGNLWVGTVDGLHRLGPDREGFQRLPLSNASARQSSEDRGLWVTDLLQAHDGRLWVATTQGVFTVEPGQPDVEGLVAAPDHGEPSAPGATEVLHLHADSEGGVWALVGTESEPQALYRWDGTRRWNRYPLHSVRQTFVITEEDGIRFDAAPAIPLATVGAETLAAEPISLPPWAMLQDREGRLWLGGVRGLFLMEPGSSIARRLGDTPAGEHRLTDEILDIFQDRAGAVWIGTYGGVLQYNPARKPFVHVDPMTGSERFADNAVSAIAEDRPGYLWVGLFGAGLTRMDLQSGEVVRYRHRPGDPDSLCDDYIWALERDAAGKLWIGSSSGLCSYEGDGRFRSHSAIPEENAAHSVVAGDDGTLWVGSPSGLYGFDPSTGRSWLQAAASDAELPVQVIADGPDGELWIGSDFPVGDVLRLEPAGEGVTRYRGVAKEGVWDIHPGPDGSAWIASGAGLLHIDAGTGRVERLDPGGLGSVYYSVARDPLRRFWLGTSQGLVRYDPAADPAERFRRYDLTDGVGNVEFNRRAVLVDGSGRMFFGGMDGLTSFDPLEVRDNPHAPPIVITDIQVLGRDGERNVNPFGLDRLVLAPDDYTVAFEFAALDFAAPAKNRYAYMLDGFDDDWIEAGTRPVARYTSIPPGQYVLRLRGSNNDGVWSRDGVSFPLTVTPPFWRTPWFGVLAFGAVVGTLTLAYRTRVARIREMERVRTRIADDLHDELGSDLAGIALTGAMLGREEYLRDRDRQRVAQVHASALRIMEGLRDIVWYIDPEHDSYEALDARMRAVAVRLLPDLEHEFHSMTPPGKTTVDMQIRPDLFLIYKELLNNAARHARASRVVIRFGVERGEIVLQVEDDGIGFDPSAAHEGTGLRSVRRRADKIGAELTVDSRPGGGTRVRLRGPL